MPLNDNGQPNDTRPDGVQPGGDTAMGRKLSLPLALEDGRVPGLFTNTAYLTAFLVAACLVWAAVGQIRELSVARGQVIPDGSVKFVHHLEGGLIDEIYVREGQLVNAGDRLIRLKPTAATSDLNELRARSAYLKLQLIRLEAHIGKDTPSFGVLGDSHAAQAAAEMKLFSSEQNYRRKEREKQDSNIARQLSGVRALREEHRSRLRQVELQKGEVERLTQLHAKRLTSKSQYSQAKFRLENAIAEEIALRGRLTEREEQLRQAQLERDESNAKSLHTYTSERSRITTELAEIRQRIEKQSDEVERLSVRAPVRGVIQELTGQSSGEVVKAGGLVAKIVPIDVDVIAEVRLDPKDSGHVQPGDEAELQISTYDPVIHGSVQGKVQTISPTTFLSEDNQPYYKVTIAIEKNFVGKTVGANPIVPGMEVKANIVTGAKSLMTYFLKPMNQSLQTAFTER